MAAHLTHLPPEILHSILGHVEAEDLAQLQQTCRLFNNFIKGNNPLWRVIYTNFLDEPPTKDLDFEQEVQDIVKLKHLCFPLETTPDTEIQSHLPFVHRVITRLLNHAVTVPSLVTRISTSSEGEGEGEDNRNDTVTRFYRPPFPRPSRARTFPVSGNALLLAGLFDSRRARRNFLTRSFLYERARVLGVDGFANEPHQLDTYGDVSGSETDTDREEEEEDEEGEGEREGEREGENGDAGGDDGNGEDEGHHLRRGRQRHPRRTRTRFGWRRPRRPREAYQLSAKLHCLYGWGLGIGDGARPGAMPAPAVESGEMRRRAMYAARQRAGVYALACAKVYDLREHTPGTKWGPFLEEEEGKGVRVDWEKVEAILVVLGTDIRCKGLERFPIFWYFWGSAFAGTWGGSYIPWSKDKEQGKDGEVKELDRMDPYGVAGSWLRVVSFLDFDDFFDFNHPGVDNLPRDVPRPPLAIRQATRLILMRIRVDKVEPPSAGDHPDHPVTYFRGFSRALDGAWDDNAQADIRGTVRVTPEGEVRWTSYSMFHGEERWKSEGVQLGGIRSARGVVGTWFDKDFNPQGPCGPTAFWKISDREDTGTGPKVLLEDLFPLIADDMEDELADEDEVSEDGVDLQVLDPFGPDWTEYELEDELAGLYYFDDYDIFDVEDVEAELEGLEGLGDDDDDDDDDDEDEDDYGIDDDDDDDDHYLH
ncbi:hypothetical protein C7999DRAFT_35078 [Corynascus novoguineensis]|uniref:F-box domain-containing protein n=1 Tax=Corynascus novoguineensis TaxID=1126955 RepID=A0AAN7HJV1_9PEZI|nr:hypothetical protein C7999DRAFT_35078 [Corynascus novoguineensis]